MSQPMMKIIVKTLSVFVCWFEILYDTVFSELWAFLIHAIHVLYTQN